MAYMSASIHLFDKIVVEMDRTHSRGGCWVRLNDGGSLTVTVFFNNLERAEMAMHEILNGIYALKGGE